MKLQIQNDWISEAESIYAENRVALKVRVVEGRGGGRVTTVRVMGDVVRRTENRFRAYVRFGTINMAITNNGRTFAHEIGHIIGLRDRYSDDPVTGYSVAHPEYEENLMSSGRQLKDAQIATIARNFNAGALRTFVASDPR